MTEPEPPPGLPNAYRSDADAGLNDRIAAAQVLVAEFNRLTGSEPVAADRMLDRLLGSRGERVEIRGPIALDLGFNISIGDGTFVNSGLTALDVAPITIGEECNIGPNVSLLTAVHPVNPGARLAGWEGAEAITIADNVWIGGGATVLAGVTVGDGAVVGAGAVVTADVPASQVAVGNPARVIRATGSARRPPVLVALVSAPVEIADDLAERLVDSGSAACVNVIDPVRSVYRWESRVKRDREALLLVKTTRPQLAALEAILEEIHPYDLPELICLPVEAGSIRYLDWIADSVGSGASDQPE